METKSQRKVGALEHYFSVLDLSMPELGTGTLGPGKYCKEISRWILCTWNGEILAIIGIAA
jgi:hypothetical protein